MANRDDDLEALANLVCSALTLARTLKLTTTNYILSMALMEVVEICDAEKTNKKDQLTN